MFRVLLAHLLVAAGAPGAGGGHGAHATGAVGVPVARHKLQNQRLAGRRRRLHV